MTIKGVGKTKFQEKLREILNQYWDGNTKAGGIILKFEEDEDQMCGDQIAELATETAERAVDKLVYKDEYLTQAEGNQMKQAIQKSFLGARERGMKRDKYRRVGERGG